MIHHQIKEIDRKIGVLTKQVAELIELQKQVGQGAVEDVDICNMSHKAEFQRGLAHRAHLDELAKRRKLRQYKQQNKEEKS